MIVFKVVSTPDLVPTSQLMGQQFRDAASKGDVSRMDALKSDIDINSPSPKSGNAALHWACKYSRHTVVTMLLDWKADVFQRNNDHRFPTQLTMDSKIRDTLLRHAQLAFITAAHIGDIASLQRMLAYPGLNIDFQDSVGDTALIKATAGGHINVIKLLLAQNASPAICNYAGVGVLTQGATTDIHRLFESYLTADTVKVAGAGLGTLSQNLFQTGILRFSQLHVFLSAMRAAGAVKSILLIGPGMLNPGSFKSLEGISPQLLDVMLLFPEAHVTVVDRENLSEMLSFDAPKVATYLDHFHGAATQFYKEGFSEIKGAKAVLNRGLASVTDGARRAQRLTFIQSPIESYSFDTQHDLVISTFSVMYAAEAIRATSSQVQVNALHCNLFRSVTNGGKLCLDLPSVHYMLPVGSERPNHKLQPILNSLQRDDGIAVTSSLLYPPSCVPEGELGWVVSTKLPDGSTHQCTTAPIILFHVSR